MASKSSPCGRRHQARLIEAARASVERDGHEALSLVAWLTAEGRIKPFMREPVTPEELRARTLEVVGGDAEAATISRAIGTPLAGVRTDDGCRP